MLEQRIRSILRSFIPLAVAITLLAGLMYITVQQLLRQGANDSQVQIAEDAAAALSSEQALPDMPPIDIASSLAPYEIVFDDQGRPVAGSGRLHGQLPTVPQGAFAYAQAHGQNRVTWQPQAGIRSAAVIVPVNGAHPGYVLAGRSLREIEARTGNLRQLIAAGWLATLAATLVTVVVAELLWSGRRSLARSGG